MRLVDALRLGLKILAEAEAAQAGVPTPVSWALKVGRRRFRLRGELVEET